MAEKTKRKLDSMLIKGIIVAVLTLLMLIPIHMVASLIEERANNKTEVTQEITSKWGGEQSITGPTLVVPYQKSQLVKKDPTNSNSPTESVQYIEYIYLLPEQYIFESDSKVEERSRSIYSTLVYQSENVIKGTFDISRIEDLRIPKTDILWNDSFLMLGVTHMQGIKNKVMVSIDGQDYEANPGVPYNDIITSGLTVGYPINKERTDQRIEFSTTLNLNGSEKLLVAPIGKENEIRMKSNWGIVSFIGDFLPTDRELNNGSFDARWNIYDYNRNYMQMWTGSNSVEMPQIGIELKYSVDQYQMSMRSVKYAIMFIALTFVIFFFIEIITKKKIHPIQYALVSLALILFYTLLISLSEHVSFALSYLAASIAIIALITFYMKSIFKKWNYTLAIGSFIAAIYTYLYVMLQLEDLALLIGSVGLFAILAAIMYASRKIDWYKREDNEQNNG